MIKQRIFFLLFCLLTTTWLVAQRGHERAPQMEMSEEVKTALQLTSEQRTELDELQASTTAQMETIRTQNVADRAAKKTAIREVRQAHKTELEGILTEEQFTQLKGLRQAEGDRRHQRAKADRKAMHDEIKAYQAANVTPVMLAQRQKLETRLNAEDIATLITIRTKLADARAEAKADRNDSPSTDQAPQRGHRRSKAGHRSGGNKALAQQFPEDQATLEAMVGRYEQPINELLEEVAPQKEQWDADLEAIKARYQPEEVAKDTQARPERAPKPERVAKREMAAKIHFLLDDPAGSRE